MKGKTEGLIEGWIDPLRLIPYADLDLDDDRIADTPDEFAFSLVSAGGAILRAIADRRPDDVGVNQVIANMAEAAQLGDSQHPGLELPPMLLGSMVYDADSANRYVRILAHFMGFCLDHTPEGGVSESLRKDSEHENGSTKAAAIAEAAALQASEHVSPFGLMMLMMLSAFRQAMKSGLTPLQAMNCVAKFSEFALSTTMPVVPRPPDGEPIDIPGPKLTKEEVRQNPPNATGTVRFLRAMNWKSTPSHPTSQTGHTPVLALARNGPVEIPILSAGYSPIDTKGNFAIGNRKALAMEFERRNSDILVISTKPTAVARGGTSYTVIGEAFVRVDGQNQRAWRPAVAWLGCKSVGALIDLARSAHFDFNEAEYADREQEVLATLRSSMKTAKR